MKHLWKMLLLIGAVLFGATACSDDDNEETVKEANLLSFGFFQADNNGVLTEDYEATITGTAVSINLPALMDKTALVARFTTSDGATVLVDSELQQSGISSNDFSIPVDYIISNGTVNQKYTVTIGKAAAGTWSKVVGFITDSIYECEMKVNPANNQLYVAYKMNKDNSADEKAAMITLKNGAWEYVGGKSLSNGRVTGVTFDFAADGTPYVAYSDYTNLNPSDGTTVLQCSSMRKLSASGWTAVGAEAITNIKTAINAFGFKADGNPIHFSYAYAANTTYGIAKRELIISNLNGSSWTMNERIPGRDATWAGYIIKTKQVGKIVYVGVLNQTGSNSVNIYKYENNAFTTLVNAHIQETADKYTVYDFEIEADAKGNVYILAADNAPDKGSVYKPHLWKYDAESKNMTIIGGDINENMSTGREFALAVAPNGTPYVLYRDDAKYPVLISIDPDSKQWTEPQTLDSFEASNLNLAISKSGVVYAGYTNPDDCLIVQKFE